jgi:hypothetical protein
LVFSISTTGFNHPPLSFLPSWQNTLTPFVSFIFSFRHQPPNRSRETPEGLKIRWDFFFIDSFIPYSLIIQSFD